MSKLQLFYDDSSDEEDKVTKEDRQQNNLFYLLKDSIVGGPSTIFNRYHEANKTYIRGLNKKCQNNNKL